MKIFLSAGALPYGNRPAKHRLAEGQEALQTVCYDADLQSD